MPREAVPSTSQTSTSQRPVKWIKKDSDGNIIYARPRSSRKQTASPSHSQGHKTGGSLVRAPETSVELPSNFPYITAVNPADVDTLGEVHQVVDEPVRQDKDTLIEKLRCLLADAGIMTDPPASPSPSSSSWKHRKQVASEHWSRAREDMMANLLAAERPPCQPCLVCRRTKAVVRCRDCLSQLLCGGCDQAVHNSHPLHNRESMFEGFFKPLSPVVGVTLKDDGYCYVNYDRLLPMSTPPICACQTGCLAGPGKTVIVIGMNGRHQLALPILKCVTCQATWNAGLPDLVASGYWPATPNFETIYCTDLFQSYSKIKLRAPGLSRQAFLGMLEDRTVAFGRTGPICGDTFQKAFLEWQLAEFVKDNLCGGDPFTCSACSPQMHAVSVDGNRKLYRFANATRGKLDRHEGNWLAGSHVSSQKDHFTILGLDLDLGLRLDLGLDLRLGLDLDLRLGLMDCGFWRLGLDLELRLGLDLRLDLELRLILELGLDLDLGLRLDLGLDLGLRLGCVVNSLNLEQLRLRLLVKQGVILGLLVWQGVSLGLLVRWGVSLGLDVYFC
ncbi:hypothetical protein N1851_014657 [Merluccius polli]|uniref:CxC3 like cysteine cluster domain-containing protein n=1 Tax=Merluccius polli TaxID=89951 RepID=A0AA47P0Q0_MERPO|nr:hypothetical protein N1851_014657 [Merluccius polli]